MNCPRCGKPIGGTVRAGTIEDARIAKGLCPHCGSAMPSGYKVGYASSFAPPPPKKYDAPVCREMAEKGKVQFPVILLEGILLGSTISLVGYPVVGLICGVLLCLLFGGFILIRPSLYPMYDGLSVTSPPGNTSAWLSLAIALFLSFTFSSAEETLPRGWPFLLAGFALAVFLTIKCRVPSYEKARGTFHKQQADDQLVDRILALHQKGALTCGKCGCTIDSGEHFSFSPKDNGAIILCPRCLPVSKSGELTLGDLTFYQI